MIHIYVGSRPVLSIPYKTKGSVICHDEISALALMERSQWNLRGLEQKLQLMFGTTDNLDYMLQNYDLRSFPSVIWYNAYILID